MMSANSLKKRLAGVAGALSLSALAVAACTLGLTSVSESAWAEESTLSCDAASTVNVTPQAASDDELTIVAGKAVRNGTVYTFPNLTVTSKSGKKIRSITVQFTTAIEAGDDVTFDTVDGFVVQGKTANRSVNASNADDANGGWDAARWEDYLRHHMKVNLISSPGGGTKGLRMIASLNKVTDTYDFNSENGHYYRYVNKPSTWTEARDAAAADTYMGLRGYLVTVTSDKESKFITTLIDTNMWMGGTAEPTFGAKNTGFTWSKPATGWPYSFYWVTGPEAKLGPGGGPMEICRMTASGTAQPVADPVNSGNAYYNFATSEPNNATGIGFYDNAGTQASGEYCLHMYSQKNSAGEATVAANIGKWNDYPNYPKSGIHQKCCYVIEYGGLEDAGNGGESGGSSGGDADVDVDVDVYVKVDINVDPEERTITTEADSITLGQPLKISENINGGVLDPVAEKVERTYVRVDANGNEVLDDSGKPIVVPESEVPYTAGRYKVTSTKPNASDGTEFKAGNAIFTVKPIAVDIARQQDASGQLQPKTYEKMYDGTADFALADVILPGILPAHANTVSLKANSAAFATAEAGNTKVVLEGARLVDDTGASTSNYTLSGMGENGSLELSARILPRELIVKASTTVSWGLAGKPLVDREGDPVAVSTNEDVHDTPAASWTENMLAQRDGERATDGTVNTILGASELVITRDSDGMALNPDNPQAGVYTVAAHFANVNPLTTRARALAASSSRDGKAFPSPITSVNDLGNGRYDIGNYMLTLQPAKIVVTSNPATDPNLDQAGDVVEGGTIEKETDPGKPPITKDDLEDLVNNEVGGKPGAIPDTDPVITIVKDGEEVDVIDPTKPGNYVVIATYPDPDGGPDKIVRFEYTVSDPKPDDPAMPNEGGGQVVIDETVKMPLDTSSDPLTKKDIEKDIEKRWPGKIPVDQTPDITIIFNGKEVDAIDPSRPGTYYVTAVYHDPNGGPDKIVRVAYTVGESTAISHKLRLAQTGDTASLTLALGAAAGAAAILSLAAKRRKKDER